MQMTSIPLIENDPYLNPFMPVIMHRIHKIQESFKRLTGSSASLSDFASGHEYFGLHFNNSQWVFREWAPNATAAYILCHQNRWQENKKFALKNNHETGVWEGRFPSGTFHHEDLYRLKLHWPGGQGDRIPSYARRVVQDPFTLIFNAQVWHPDIPYAWQHPDAVFSADPLLIYEAHVGMARKRGRWVRIRNLPTTSFPELPHPVTTPSS